MTRSARLAAVLIAVGLSTAALAPFALAGSDERSEAEGIVAELTRDPAHKALTAETVQHAKDALERAKRMRAAGDEAHARLADGLALEWAQMAKDLVAAVDAEQSASGARHAALDAGAELERQRTMLEESITRAGRLRAELAAAEREARETNRTAASGADASAPKPRRAHPPAQPMNGPSPHASPPTAPPSPITAPTTAPSSSSGGGE